MAPGQQLVMVHLDPTADVRSTLAALKISVVGGNGQNPQNPFTAQLEAESSVAAAREVRRALEPRWGDVRVEAVGPVG